MNKKQSEFTKFENFQFFFTRCIESCHLAAVRQVQMRALRHQFGRHQTSVEAVNGARIDLSARLSVLDIQRILAELIEKTSSVFGAKLVVNWPITP